MKDHDINEYDTKIVTVHGLDKDRNPLQYISSRMRQSVIAGIKSSLKILSSLKKNNHQVGGLRYKSDYASVNYSAYRGRSFLADSVVLGLLLSCIFLLWPNIFYTCRPVYLVYLSIVENCSPVNLTCTIHLQPMEVGVSSCDSR